MMTEELKNLLEHYNQGLALYRARNSKKPRKLSGKPWKCGRLTGPQPCISSAATCFSKNRLLLTGTAYSQ